MFGQWLCVGIFTNEIYLPEGEWTDYWTGERIQSRGEIVSRSYPEDRAGLLFVREGAIIPCVEGLKYIGNKPFDTYTVKFYPHGESSYTMYDSDAESYGYEEGRIASTRFGSSVSGKEVTLTVSPVEGSFENMPAERNYTFEVYLPSAPRKVTVDGNVMKEWSYSDGILTLTLSEVPVSDRITVGIVMK